MTRRRAKAQGHGAQHEDLGILLAMIYAGWSDGQLTDKELALIKAEMRDQGLDPAEIRRVQNALISPPDLSVISGFLVSADSRRAALAAAWVTALADTSLALSEMRDILALADALGIAKAEQVQIRAFAEAEALLVSQGKWKEALLLEHHPSPKRPARRLSRAQR